MYLAGVSSQYVRLLMAANAAEAARGRLCTVCRIPIQCFVACEELNSARGWVEMHRNTGVAITKLMVLWRRAEGSVSGKLPDDPISPRGAGFLQADLALEMGASTKAIIQPLLSTEHSPFASGASRARLAKLTLEDF